MFRGKEKGRGDILQREKGNQKRDRGLSVYVSLHLSLGHLGTTELYKTNHKRVSLSDGYRPRGRLCLNVKLLCA